MCSLPHLRLANNELNGNDIDISTLQKISTLNFKQNNFSLLSR